MKARASFVIFGVVFGALGCTFTLSTPSAPTQADQVATVVAATMQALTAAPSQAASTQVETQISGTAVSFENVSFVIPSGLASGANTEKMTAVDTNSGAPWEIAPTHLRFTLTSYQLQDKFHQPQVYVYPADEYAAVNPNAAFQIESIKRIRAGSAILKETLPRIPWFNAELLIAASIKMIPFENGRGVRTLTEYAQYYAPINNNELIYQFQGLTDDDKYYVFAILPITAPILAEDEKPESTVPADGVPIPPNIGPNESYYFSVTEKLNSLAPDAFTPSLNTLDALIQSILLTTP